MEFELFNYMYWELTIGIVVVTMVLNKMLQLRKLVHLKWVTFIIASFGGVVHYLTHHDSSVWKIVISVGIATLAYDYVVKVITDKIAGKNVITPNH